MTHPPTPRFIPESSQPAGTLLRELKQLHPVRGGLIGESEPIRHLFERVLAIAEADHPVLIRGEAGTEMESVARACHWNSERSTGPFVAERGANLREPHLLKQLFGHARGAFAGAGAPAQGLVGEADGGTLYLEEIADLPLSAQASLVRVLARGEYRPIGASAVKHSDFRVITSSTSDVRDLVASGAFRSDLYFQLRGAILSIPPLRDRKGDLPGIVTEIVRAESQRRKETLPPIDPSTMSAIVEYDWPGNIAELRHEILTAFAVARGRPVTPSMLQFPHSPASLGVRRTQPNYGLRRKLGEVEAVAIQDALRLAGGNKSEAARRLGVTRRTLYRRIAAISGDPTVITAGDAYGEPLPNDVHAP